MTRLFNTDPVAVRWLTEKGVWRPELSHAQNMARCAEYRSRLGRIGADPGKQWARDLVEQYRAGKPVPAYSIRLAMAALDMPAEPILSKTAKPVPRPDHMERAAGDVEVQF